MSDAAVLDIDVSSVGYTRDAPVLRNVQLRVLPGECVAILGGNGAGKTVLLRWIAGLLPLGGGTRKFRECSIDSVRDAVRLGVGLVVQDPDDQLLGATVREDAEIGPRNLGVSAEVLRSRVDAALARVGLSRLAERAIETLSLGERKRASLAGMLAMQPRLLLLDEPTAGIDPAGELELCATLRELRDSGGTLLVATHAVDLVPLFATRVVLLGEARVLADGPCVEVLANAKLLARARVRRPWTAELWARLRGEDDAVAPPLTLEELTRRMKQE